MTQFPYVAKHNIKSGRAYYGWKKNISGLKLSFHAYNPNNSHSYSVYFWGELLSITICSLQTVSKRAHYRETALMQQHFPLLSADFPSLNTLESPTIVIFTHNQNDGGRV